MTQENLRIPVLLNGEGEYLKSRQYYFQPIDYHRSQKIEIPPGCFVMMVTQEEFKILKNSQGRMLANGILTKHDKYGE